MASTVAREQSGILIEQHPSEIDSESSSGCDDRDVRKRLREDVDNNSSSSSPKKRRKQTTPVRVPTSLMTGVERHESDDEADEVDLDAAESGETYAAADVPIDEDEQQQLEGKQRTLSPQTLARTFLHTTIATTKDENLNSEFRCQFCGLFYDDKETLARHHECEHGAGTNSLQATPSESPHSSHVRIKLEPQQQNLDESENPVNLSGLAIKSFAATWLNSHAQAHHQLQSQADNTDWPSSSSLPSVPSHLQALSFPGSLAQYLPMPGFSMADAGQLPRPPLGPAPIRIFNPDAYCDLCNKEFCNKYFLKTHKANKHGIYMDPPNSNSSDNNIAGTLFAGAFGTSNIKMEQPPRLEVPVPLISVPTTNMIPCELCQKRFKNEDSLRKHKQKIHSDGTMEHQESHSLPATGSSVEEDREISRNSPGAMEALFKQEFGVEQEDSKFMPAPRHLSPQSSQQARDSGFNVDRLRRLGVLNPEAFCEICCKEYCNKYFLRTHKMKRHGILIQDNEKSPSNPGNAATWHQIQTSPLNLIITDSNPPNSSEFGDRPGEDFECKPCGFRFQTIGLYRAHRAKIHETEEQSSPKNDYESESTEQRTDSISEDLQKLQTMILQLNGLASGKTSNCGICGKDYDSVIALKSHMNLEHSGITGEVTSPARTEILSNGASTFCTLCEKDYQNPEVLRRHITEEHQNTTNNTIPTTNPQPSAISTPVSIQTSVPTTPVVISVPSTAPAPTATPPQSERKVISMTPTSSYCEICNKELCNKYFMKTHMQKMHNIEIENGSQIGGVICNICNKELCSKYFLRVHKQNTHGIVDEASATTNKQEAYEPANPDDTALKPDQLGDLSHRYFTHFTEVCPICSRRFRSIKWLKAHLLGEHGRAGADKWREVEHQYQNSTRLGVKSSGTSSRIGQPNQSLKIPNGLEMVSQLKTNDYVGFGSQVLSNLFGSSIEEQQTKSYRCSYCNFTTTVLPFLFLHERSHTSSQENNSGMEIPLQCPICSQNFAQPELLHHHLLTGHQFSGLLSQFQAPVVNSPRAEMVSVERNNEHCDKGEYEVKDDRRQDSPQVSLGNSESSKSQKTEEPAVQVTAQGAYKCAQCGYATANLTRIKKHIRKDHKTLGDPTDSVIAELSKTLREVANKHKVPASYAMPQDMNSNPDATVMQPFLIEERDVTRIGDDNNSEKRFVPALVYLPVRARVNNVLTMSFTLSPA